jgi:MFS transporter, putative metabolite:H+ symporter
MADNQEISKKSLFFLIAVSALGYFVDVFDLLLFSVVRKKSLLDIGVLENDSLSIGLSLLNYQMVGLVLGGILWGVVGDKKGRLTVLFGSIVLYSVANILNGFVTTVDQYKALRLIAGIGLAGELGAGITLVSEVMKKETRGYGGMIIATVGLLGAVVASNVGLHYSWRTSFIVGGVMGLILLLMRIGVYESGLYNKIKNENIKRGNFFQLFSSWKIFSKYMRTILVGLPTYFIVGLLVTGSPEFGKALGMTEIPVAGLAVMYCYIGLTVGDLICTTLSQILRTRKLAFYIFNVLCLFSIALFLFYPSLNAGGFYFRCFLLGFSVGYWALITINASEQFGTNLRATAATTVPNFVRATTIPVSFVFAQTKDSLGVIHSAAFIGFTTVIIAIVATYFSNETFGKDLDYTEGTKS